LSDSLREQTKLKAVSDFRGHLSPRAARRDAAIYHLIPRISGNGLLIDIHRTFAGILRESQSLPTRWPAPLFPAINEHERILQSIAMNDPDGAGYYMRTHISMAGNRAGLLPTELA
jgi:GntR family transcriptional repressor for pyruvate dehydrogenase complex